MNHDSGYPVMCGNLYLAGGRGPITAEVCSKQVHQFFDETSVPCQKCMHQASCRIAGMGPAHDAD
jgi:hypothetical protein